MARPVRLAALDSVRGLLALSVFLFHIVLVHYPGIASDNPAPATSLGEWLVTNSLLRIFWSGHQAVVGFFVLSGFVLTLSFSSLRRADSFGGAWLRFALRRFFRLYPAYVIALPLALFAVWVVNGSLDLSALPGHVLMIGAFNQNAYNSGIWSLVVEARISLVFPLIVLLALRWPWWLSLASSWALGSVIGLASGSGDITSFAQTPAVVPLFVIGIVAAKHRTELAAFWRALGLWGRIGLGVGACAVYTLPGTIPYGWILRSHWLLDPAIGLSLLPLLAAALAGGQVTRILETGPLHWLGERAYGVYLLHPPLLMLAGAVAGTQAWVLAAAQLAAFLLLLLLAHLLYVLVELPGIRVGHRVTEHPLQQPGTKTSPDRQPG